MTDSSGVDAIETKRSCRVTAPLKTPEPPSWAWAGAVLPVFGEIDDVEDGGGEVADFFAALPGDVTGH